MKQAHYIDDKLFVESCAVQTIAEQYETPCYIYSSAELKANIQRYERVLDGHPHCIAYAVKANSNLSLLKLIDEQGLGFDIVSIGEFKRLLQVGVDPAKVFYSGVGKTIAEIDKALQHNIGCFNVESMPELERITKVALSQNKQANIAIRINPDVDPKTHPYISTGQKHNKFGVEIDEARKLFEFARGENSLNIRGLSFHIGSQLQTVEPIIEAFESAVSFIKELIESSIELEFIDIGGGLGVAYHEDDTFPEPEAYLPHIIKRLNEASLDLQLVIEPGRSIIASAGMLVTQVQFIKETQNGSFAIVDAGMNDFGRPALYNAYHQIWPVQGSAKPKQHYDVVGPICESADFLAKERPLNIGSDDLIAVLHTGAYGMTMSSNYNTRGRVAEVLVDGDAHRLIRRRETFEDLISHEVI